MKIKSIIISNYKSLGEERNVLLLEDNITALIGKNDSGKSNILEALGNISFILTMIFLVRKIVIQIGI